MWSLLCWVTAWAKFWRHDSAQLMREQEEICVADGVRKAGKEGRVAGPALCGYEPWRFFRLRRAQADWCFKQSLICRAEPPSEIHLKGDTWCCFVCVCVCLLLIQKVNPLPKVLCLSSGSVYPRTEVFKLWPTGHIWSPTCFINKEHSFVISLCSPLWLISKWSWVVAI